MTNEADAVGKLILRVTLGVLILMHGLSKITGGVGGIQGMLQGAGLPGELAWAAYLGEVVGPILLIAGWYGRVGAALIATNMLFAIGLAHSNELLALTENGGWALELQGMFLVSAIALVLMGPGRMGFNER